MNNEQRGRLEQELRFLKESLEADVISRDEYERGRERIERKLEEVEEKPEEKIEEPKEIEEEKKPIEEEPKEEVIEEQKEIKEEPKIEIKEIREEKPRRIEEQRIKDSPTSKSKDFEEAGEEKEEIPREEEKSEEKKGAFEVEEEKEEIKESEKEREGPEEEIQISKKWLYGIVILIIVVILFFSIRGCKSTEEGVMEEEQIEEKPIEEFVPECSSNSDCKQEGMIGVCLNAGTKEAECEFKEDVKTELIVINDKDCKLCDSSSMKNIMKEIFPNVKISEFDYGAAEAKRLVNKFDIDALPAYIFDSNVKETINFNDFKSALMKKENNYVMTKTASGASYYFERPLIKNKLDLYILPGTNEKIEASVQEVLELFKEKINFTKHIVTEGQKEALEKELGINTYPAFLLNNQLKFGGILPANMIKENICKVNYFEECSKELSKV